jgi:flagellar motor protein MotB
MMSEELAALRIAMRDQNKSNEERLAAAKQYMDKVKPIYEQEIRLAKELMDAQAGKWLAGTDIKDSEAARNDLMKFLVDYGKDKGLASKIASYLKMDEGASRKALWEDINAYGRQNGYTNYITDLAEIYEKWRGDKDTQPLVEAIVNAYNARAGLNEDTRMVQTIENSISAAMRKEQDDLDKAKEALAQEVLNVRAETLKTFESDMAKLDKAIEAMNNAEIEIEIPEIDLSALEIADATIQEFIGNFQAELEEIAALNQMLSDSIASSISGGVQAFTEMLFDLDNADPSQILAAMMQPFAQTAIQLGEMLIAQGVAVEAFKNSLKSLQGGAAIAAGAALVAIGAAMSAGIKSLAGGGASGTTSASTYDSGSYSSDGYDTYESNIVVEVVGKISGSDILIAGSKQQNKWNR